METKKRVGYAQNLLATIEAYYKPLRALKTELPWDAIVFVCGTLVRLDCTETRHRSIESFTEDVELDTFLRQDFPGLSYTTYEKWREGTQYGFQWALQRHPEWREQIKKAYGCLMLSGYPLPGGIGGDRTVFPWNADRDTQQLTYMTIFTHLGACCCTLFLLDSVPAQVEQAYPQADAAEEDGPYNRLCCMQSDRALIGEVDQGTAEMRRLDYVSPKPFAYIDKKMKISLF
jgi:hypothetical protein